MESGTGLGMSLREDLADIITGRLEALGWTQSELAERAGKQEPTISRIIHTDANVRVSTIGDICRALGVKPKLVAQNIENPKSKETLEAERQTYAGIIEEEHKEAVSGAVGNAVIQYLSTHGLWSAQALDESTDEYKPDRYDAIRAAARRGARDHFMFSALAWHGGAVRDIPIGRVYGAREADSGDLGVCDRSLSGQARTWRLMAWEDGRRQPDLSDDPGQSFREDLLPRLHHASFANWIQVHHDAGLTR